MVNTWITFFFSLLAGALSALIGVYIQAWYTKRKTQKRLITALKNELQVNLRRIDENITYLQSAKDGKGRLILASPFIVRAYETTLLEEPWLFFKLSSKTNMLLDEVYTWLLLHNAWFNAMAFGILDFRDADAAINNLKIIKKKIEEVLNIIKN